MTSYTCKRGDCVMTHVLAHRRGVSSQITLNGERMTASEIGSKLGLSADSTMRRLKRQKCLQVPQESGNRKQKAQTPADARSDSASLAAKFNQLPRVAYGWSPLEKKVAA